MKWTFIKYMNEVDCAYTFKIANCHTFILSLSIYPSTICSGNTASDESLARWMDLGGASIPVDGVKEAGSQRLEIGA